MNGKFQKMLHFPEIFLHKNSVMFNAEKGRNVNRQQKREYG
ncbi:hypothetical protein [Citrobacter pasteurii]|nr:hypothetical protein SF123566_1019 [Shigella flexneri 1235-66]CEJ65906.1 hypothetical protein [Citrobacter pasteurii]